jgi:hypothetical protein
MCVGGRCPERYRIGEVNKYQQKAMTAVVNLEDLHTQGFTQTIDQLSRKLRFRESYSSHRISMALIWILY